MDIFIILPNQLFDITYLATNLPKKYKKNIYMGTP